MKKLLKVLGWLALGLVGLIVIAVIFDGTSSNFEVRRTDHFLRGDGKQLDISNISKGPITINSIRVNERDDCKTFRTALLATSELKLPITMKVGDKFSVGTTCQVIRVELSTDKGTVTYSFN